MIGDKVEFKVLCCISDDATIKTTASAGAGAGVTRPVQPPGYGAQPSYPTGQAAPLMAQPGMSPQPQMMPMQPPPAYQQPPPPAPGPAQYPPPPAPAAPQDAAYPPPGPAAYPPPGNLY